MENKINLDVFGSINNAMLDSTVSILMVRFSTSTQFYKHFTGLYLQVCKYRSVFKITFTPKYCKIKCGNDRQLKIFELNSKNKHEHIEIGITC